MLNAAAAYDIDPWGLEIQSLNAMPSSISIKKTIAYIDYRRAELRGLSWTVLTSSHSNLPMKLIDSWSITQ